MTIVHAWSQSAVPWCVRLASRRRRVLLQVEWGDDLPTIARETSRPDVSLVAGSAGLRQRLLGFGAPPARVAIVGPCVDASALARASRSAVRAQLGLSDAHRAIVIVPPVTRAGGALHAAWAALLLEKVRPDIRLVVPAGGREAERIRRLIQACAHGHMVCYAPAHLALPDLLAAADVAAYTPPASAPIAGLLWAMAAGCPIVATDVPAVSEWLAGGSAAGLCRPGRPQDIAHCMLTTLEQAGGSEPFARRAREVAAAYAVDHGIDAYRRLYAALAHT